MNSISEEERFCRFAMSVQGQEHSHLPALRPGLEKFTTGDAFTEQCDSAIGSMPYTREDEETGMTGSTVLAREEGSVVEGGPKQLRPGLEKFDRMATNQSITDSAFESMGSQLCSLDTAEEPTTVIPTSVRGDANKNSVTVDSRPAPCPVKPLPTLSNTSSAMSWAVKVALGGAWPELAYGSRGSIEAFQENSNCHNYACCADERYLLAPYRGLLLKPDEDGDT